MQKKNKLLKRIIINALFLLLIFLLTDYIYFKIIEFNYRQDCKKNNMIIDHNVRYKTYDFIKKNDNTTTNVYKYFLEEKQYKCSILPPPLTTNNKVIEPIILFGDSYTWLFNEEGLQGQLAKYTNREVFNFAYWGWGAQHMFYLISNPLLYKIINDETSLEPKYAIYTYIRDHKNRLISIIDYYLDIEPCLTYKINKEGKILGIKKYNFFKRLLFRSFMFRYISKKNLQKNDLDAYKELEILISQSYLELKKHYPNIKFIIFEYYQETEEIPEETQMFENLQKIGITYISTKNLTDKNLLDNEYTTDDGYHPNVKAWDLIVKPLAKKLEKM